jgi:hypothetical protein
MNDPGRFETMWNLESWTENQRNFFDEISEVVRWLEGKQVFVKKISSTGGKISVIAQLSGHANIGDELGPSTLALASMMGLSIGVEVFPKIRRTW